MNEIPIWSESKSHHWVWLQWHQADRFSEGGVSLSGQMLGVGEYEYSFLVRPADLPALWAAFGVPFGDDREAFADAFRSRWAEVHKAGVGEWFTAHGIPYSPWSRFED
jgi:hypothetical protein